MLTIGGRAAGHRDILEWLRQFGEVRIAVEDCRHLTRRVGTDLLGAGHSVVRVHTRLMAGMRRSGREPGKSYPVGAEAVARVALREDRAIRYTARLAEASVESRGDSYDCQSVSAGSVLDSDSPGRGGLTPAYD